MTPTVGPYTNIVFAFPFDAHLFKNPEWQVLGFNNIKTLVGGGGTHNVFKTFLVYVLRTLPGSIQ